MSHNPPALKTVPRVPCRKCRRFKWADAPCRCQEKSTVYTPRTDGLMPPLPAVPHYDELEELCEVLGTAVTIRPKYGGNYGDGNGGSW